LASAPIRVNGTGGTLTLWLTKLRGTDLTKYLHFVPSAGLRKEKIVSHFGVLKNLPNCELHQLK
jgi:hypothetical protein